MNEIYTKTFLDDILPYIDKWLETTDYPVDNKCYSNVNQKMMGKFKDVFVMVWF